jgi:endonuclease/exonuclease/phosphatase (EEP) superfamily protein YafD
VGAKRAADLESDTSLPLAKAALCGTAASEQERAMQQAAETMNAQARTQQQLARTIEKQARAMEQQAETILQLKQQLADAGVAAVPVSVNCKEEDFESGYTFV